MTLFLSESRNCRLVSVVIFIIKDFYNDWRREVEFICSWLVNVL